MAQKRKAITTDSPEADEVALSDGGSELGDVVYGDLESSGDDSELDDENDLEDSDGEDEEDEDEFGEFEEETDLTEEDEDEEQLPASKTKESVLERKEPQYTITKDANGRTRFVWREIEPYYDSDDSDAHITTTTGNIDPSLYESFPHIGYDINGKKVPRPPRDEGQALDTLLASIEVPQGWTGLKDPATGKPLNLSAEELDVLKRFQRNEVPEDGYDPYEPMVEYFSGKLETMPLSSAPEPKRRFVPSKHEAKRIIKLVRAIREGRIKPWRPSEDQEEEEDDIVRHDIWANESARKDHPMDLGPAPKLPFPTHSESVRPPKEYLFDDKERQEWEEAEPEDRSTDYMPTEYNSLREVPAFDNFLKQRFDRALDLYLAPRSRKNRLNIDPNSLLPQLPSPEELRPYPSRTACHFVHTSRVRTIDVSPNRQFIATGDDEGNLRIWETLTGYKAFAINLGGSEPISALRWCPGTDKFILAAACGETLFWLIPPLCSPAVEAHSHDLLSAGFGYSASSSSTSSTKKTNSDPWTRPNLPHSSLPTSPTACVLLSTTLRGPIKSLSVHRGADYFATVSPNSQSSAVAIHRLSKHLTQFPFRRLKGGLPQCATFHPTRPQFFIVLQNQIRCYDLSRQTLIKKLSPGAKWNASISVHPSGDHVLVGSLDRRLLWHDLELGDRPYKTLRYHSKAIRSVQFSNSYPLFADASDDGTIQVFHGSTNDMSNATIVPLKILKGHKVHNQLGVLDIRWIDRRAFLCSSAADGDVRLWV